MTLDEHKALLAEAIAINATLHRKTAMLLAYLRRYIRQHELPLAVAVVYGPDGDTVSIVDV